MSPRHHTGLRIPLVSIYVFHRNWNDVINHNKEKCQRNRLCPKCHRCPGQKILRASPWPRWGFRMAVWRTAMETWEHWRGKGKQTPQTRATAATVPHHCRQRPGKCNTCVYIPLYDQFPQQHFHHPTSTFQCHHIVLLFLLPLLTRQHLGLQRAAIGNFYL